MDEKELLSSLVGKTLNLPNEEISALLYGEDGTIKPEALDELLTRDAGRIKTLKDEHEKELTKIHDKGYKKAQAESLSKFEAELKEEFQIQADLKGKDLVKEIVSKMAKDTSLTEEQVKRHPKFLELERKLTSEYIPKADHEKVVNDYNDYKKTFERRQTLGTVSKDALAIFMSLKPVLSKDAAKAQNQQMFLLEKLSAFDYELQQDGNHIILSDGKRLETPQGHPKKFADFIQEEAAKYYDFEVQGGKGNAGNQGGNGGSSGGSVTVPKTKDEYLRAIANEQDPLKRVAIKKAFEESQK